MLEEAKRAVQCLFLSLDEEVAKDVKKKIQPLFDEIERLRIERDKLQKFKDWTHTRLDMMGVPHSPPGPHGAEGCRIGDRMDWLENQLKTAQSALKPSSN